jgi:hypothetical protein
VTTFEKDFNDPRAQRVLGFFMAKGLLVGQEVPRRGDVKLNLDDVLWVADRVEPRVLEVLPAAMIHFPRTFLATAQAPDDLADVIRAIKAGDEQGPDFRGMRFRAMRKWANRATKDKRTKPLSQIKRNKTLRLSPEALHALESGAENAGVSQTQFIERLLIQTQDGKETG